MPLRTAIADDEPIALNRLGRMLREAGWEVVKEVQDGRDLLTWMHEARPQLDALFLDIAMPSLSGLEVLAELDCPPPIVFVTANAEHAVQAFEHAAFDYLVKPVTAERLAKTLQRLQGGAQPRPGPESKTLPPATHIRFPVKAGEGKLLLEMRKVTHFEVVDQVVWAHAGKQKFRTTWVSLTDVEEAFPQVGLMRIQRHLLLRPEAVLGIRSLPSGRRAVLVTDGIELEASRSAAHSLKVRLGL